MRPQVAAACTIEEVGVEIPGGEFRRVKLLAHKLEKIVTVSDLEKIFKLFDVPYLKIKIRRPDSFEFRHEQIA